MKSVNYPSYVIKYIGLQVDPKKIKVIKDWPTPRYNHRLRSFVGIEIFYHIFIWIQQHFLANESTDEGRWKDNIYIDEITTS
jgi:hypothetical protein